MNGTTACKWDSVIPFEAMWERLNKLSDKNTPILLFGSQPFTSMLVYSNIKNFKATWYWQKERGTNFVQAKRYPMRVVEECVLFCKGTPIYNPKMRDVKPYTHVLPKPKNGDSQHMDSKSIDDNGNRIYKQYNKAYPINVLNIPRDNMSSGKSFHPTQKPVALMEYLIETHTNEGDVVLDFTMGSFTTAIACLNTKRNFIGIELDKNYFKIGSERLEKHLEKLDYKPKIVYNQE